MEVHVSQCPRATGFPKSKLGIFASSYLGCSSPQVTWQSWTSWQWWQGSGCRPRSSPRGGWSRRWRGRRRRKLWPCWGVRRRLRTAHSPACRGRGGCSRWTAEMKWPDQNVKCPLIFNNYENKLNSREIIVIKTKQK